MNFQCLSMDCACMAHPPIVKINATSLLTHLITIFLFILVLPAIWNNLDIAKLEPRPPKTFKMERVLQQKTAALNLWLLLQTSPSQMFAVVLATLLQNTEKYLNLRKKLVRKMLKNNYYLKKRWKAVLNLFSMTLYINCPYRD